jgi:hypothetical protein
MREEIMRPPASVASAIIFDQTMRDYRPVLPKVDVPTLVVTGADEKLVSVAAEELIASEMPDARVVVFEESSHCPFLEETDRFNETVGEFVRSPLRTVSRRRRRAPARGRPRGPRRARSRRRGESGSAARRRRPANVPGAPSDSPLRRGSSHG